MMIVRKRKCVGLHVGGSHVDRKERERGGVGEGETDQVLWRWGECYSPAQHPLQERERADTPTQGPTSSSDCETEKKRQRIEGSRRSVGLVMGFWDSHDSQQSWWSQLGWMRVLNRRDRHVAFKVCSELSWTPGFRITQKARSVKKEREAFETIGSLNRYSYLI